MAITVKTHSFTLEPGLVARLKSRITKGSRSELLSRMLLEYMDALDDGLRQAQGKLTKSEASAILDVQNGTVTQPIGMWLGDALALQIHDSIPDGIAEKWGIDAPALVAKLQAMTQIETWALLDWAARFWTGDIKDMQAVPKAVAGFLEG
jgi:hypothetical protein